MVVFFWPPAMRRASVKKPRFENTDDEGTLTRSTFKALFQRSNSVKSDRGFSDWSDTPAATSRAASQKRTLFLSAENVGLSGGNYFDILPYEIYLGIKLELFERYECIFDFS